MSDNHDIEKSLKKYNMVFFALIAGTIITVGAYFIHIDSVLLTIALALFIASVKAFLVAGYFMHLIDEKKAIYGVLASTAFFFVALVTLFIWSAHDFPTLTTFWDHLHPVAEGAKH